MLLRVCVCVRLIRRRRKKNDLSIESSISQDPFDRLTQINLHSDSEKSSSLIFSSFFFLFPKKRIVAEGEEEGEKKKIFYQATASLVFCYLARAHNCVLSTKVIARRSRHYAPASTHFFFYSGLYVHVSLHFVNREQKNRNVSVTSKA